MINTKESNTGKLGFSMVKKYKLNIFCVYSIFFLLLFLQFPLNDALPGNCDSLAVISLSNDYINRIGSFFSGETPTVFLYPEMHAYKFGESSIGGASLFIFFRLIGFNNIWSYYFFISSIFIFTAFSIFLLSRSYTKNSLAAFFSGLAFTCSSFTFANIDDSVVFFFAIPALSLLFLKRFLEGKSNYNILAAAILGGIQIYFNLYVFFYQTIFILIVMLFHFKRHRSFPQARWLSASMLIYLLLPIPFVQFYLHTLNNKQFYDIWMDLGMNDWATLEWKDFFKVTENNLLYSKVLGWKNTLTYWLDARKCAFLGFVLPLFAILGMRKAKKWRAEIITAAIIGLILCIGVNVGKSYHPKIVGLNGLLDWAIPSFKYMRVPFRSYFLFIFSLSLLAAYSLNDLQVWLQSKFNKLASKLIVLSIFALFIIESIPVPLRQFELGKHLEAPTAYAQFFQDKKEVVLDLPTSIWPGDTSAILHEYNRELIYMTWQTQHSNDAVTGLNGYYPLSRIKLQSIISDLPSRSAFDKLKEYDVTYIVFHKQMVIKQSASDPRLKRKTNPSYFQIVKEEELLTKLEKSSCLTKELDNETSYIFRIDYSCGGI